MSRAGWTVRGTPNHFKRAQRDAPTRLTFERAGGPEHLPADTPADHVDTHEGAADDDVDTADADASDYDDMGGDVGGDDFA